MNIRYVRTQSSGLGSGAKPKITSGLIAGTDKGGIHIFAFPMTGNDMP
jgi:hypothetical protein